DIENYLSLFIKMGYEQVSMVTTPGEYSRRGGIIDIYPVTEEHPIRVELFDTEVDSIRYFDADTQSSLQKGDEVIVGPAKELLLTDEDMITAADKIKKALANTLKSMKNAQDKERLIENIDYDVDQLKNLTSFQDMAK